MEYCMKAYNFGISKKPKKVKSMRHIITLFMICLLTIIAGKSFAQLDVALLLGERSKSLDLPIAFGGFLKLGVPISLADEISVEASNLTWGEGEAGYFVGKLGYVHTLNREGYGWFIEPQLGYAFVGSDPLFSDNNGTGDFKGVIGSMSAGYRFGQDRAKWDLSLRYENVFTNNVGRISILGLRFTRSFGIGRGKYYE